MHNPVLYMDIIKFLDRPRLAVNEYYTGPGLELSEDILVSLCDLE